MATISLNKEVATRNGVTIDEALLLVAIYNKCDLESAKEGLINKGYITAAGVDTLFTKSGYRVTRLGTSILDNVIVNSDKHQEPEYRLIKLASKLKEIFPKGKKPGTNYYWAEGGALIVRRLKLFFKKYGEYIEETFRTSDMSDEEFNNLIDTKIITAAKSYVESFNGVYQYMKLLKYFILKDKIGAARDVENESELLNYIENEGQDTNQNWENELR